MLMTSALLDPLHHHMPVVSDSQSLPYLGLIRQPDYSIYVRRAYLCELYLPFLLHSRLDRID